MKKDPTGKIFGAVIAVLITMILAGLIMLFVLTKDDTKEQLQNINQAKSSTALKLYDKIVNTDLQAEYPTTPEDVMAFYCDTISLLYGNLIYDQAMIKDVIVQQRMLLSDTLLDMNTEDSQIEFLNKAIEIIYGKNVYSISLEQKPPLYDDLDPKKCAIRVIHFFSNSPNEYMLYYLEKTVNGRWKIINWEPTDSDFLPLYQEQSLG